jgi:hypothetical protein
VFLFNAYNDKTKIMPKNAFDSVCKKEFYQLVSQEICSAVISAAVVTGNICNKVLLLEQGPPVRC